VEGTFEPSGLFTWRKLLSLIASSRGGTFPLTRLDRDF
jgi:hypothetical protein